MAVAERALASVLRKYAGSLRGGGGGKLTSWMVQASSHKHWDRSNILKTPSDCRHLGHAKSIYSKRWPACTSNCMVQ